MAIKDGITIFLYFCNIHLHFSSKKFGDSKYYHYLCSRKNEQPHITHIFGEMLEWLKRHAWKACKPLKGFTGSNPVLSASSACKNLQALFVFY